MREIQGVYKKSLEGFKFIDLFAGIGGFHYALSSFGAECVFASEWDKDASLVYQLNHKIKPEGDITEIKNEDIPFHDILCGGFPCQAFSISGKQGGFQDARGTLFFEIARIVEFHKPKILFLENVKNFYKHDNGRTFELVKKIIDELGYNLNFKILNTSNFGLPQNRERIYLVAFRKDLGIKSFCFPEKFEISNLKDILIEDDPEIKFINRTDVKIYKSIEQKNLLFPESLIYNRPIQIGKVNKGGQGERIYHPIGHSVTLSAYGGGPGAKTGLYFTDEGIRKLTPRECARVQGFPDNFILHQNKNKSYMQFGNSVSINVLQFILEKIVDSLKGN
jgi:DNA (cytosine-5)-methyltransferase 1